MKGISEIIAVILMLMIVVGLAGTAFIYIQGSLTGRTTKQIEIEDVSCNAPTSIYATVKNMDARLAISTSDLTIVRVDNTPVTGTLSWSYPIINSTTQGGSTNDVLTLTCGANGVPTCPVGSQHTVKVVGPSNTEEKSAVC